MEEEEDQMYAQSAIFDMCRITCLFHFPSRFQDDEKQYSRMKRKELENKELREPMNSSFCQHQCAQTYHKDRSSDA